MHVKVLGSGCMNCTTLERRTREALRQLGLSAEIEKVQEIKEIMSYGLLSTPGLVVDGKLILDFNKVYNPPCAFTPFATCPLPPKENVLPFPLRAGEKKYRGEHH